MKLARGITRGTTAAFLGIALIGALPVSAVAATPAALVSSEITSTAEAAPQVSRQELLDRAASWLTANNGEQVPYHNDQYWDGWRQDCSGYVSMAAKLATPGPNTVGLASADFTHDIAVADMLPGDLFIDSTGGAVSDRHVVIFEKWNNPEKTEYTAYEQRGDHGTDHRARKYGLGGDEYQAKRLNNVVD
ncbi:hypothetical protein KCV87_11950 [Actinosynnema pretiosum subsp. pretiosum]|uniref:Uncharacterized protein n=1 Tax=Actinosynnema pretiosum subsp. pretiosum TaxID=103721 RepID=A0AA45R6B3_9PSEU|nr:putative membrane protein [Actinosynnema pretiosum subsp. pretiosum]QUF06694.1 hypothetical protein KCV87_11950 [Actinosynnema pretiosum subsp. pretiosum]